MDIGVSQDGYFNFAVRPYGFTTGDSNVSQQYWMLGNSTENFDSFCASEKTNNDQMAALIESLIGSKPAPREDLMYDTMMKDLHDAMMNIDIEKSLERSNNNQMTITMKSIFGSGAVCKNLTYNTMMQAGYGEYDCMSRMRVKDRDGNVLVSQADDYDTDCLEYLRLMTGNPEAEWRSDGTFKTFEMGADGELHPVTYKRDNSLWLDISEVDNTFQEGLRNGAYVLEQQRANDNGDQIWINTSPTRSTCISDYAPSSSSSSSLSPGQMTLTMKSNIGGNAVFQENFTYNTMMMAGYGEYDQMSRMRVKDQDGNILLSKANSSDADCLGYLRLMTGDSEAVWGSDGTYTSVEIGADGEMHQVVYKRDKSLWLDISATDNAFQEGLKTGVYILEEEKRNENGDFCWENTPPASASSIFINTSNDGDSSGNKSTFSQVLKIADGSQITLAMKSKLGGEVEHKNLTFDTMMQAGYGEYEQMARLRVKDEDGYVLVSQANANDKDCLDYLRLMTGCSEAMWRSDGTFTWYEEDPYGSMAQVFYKRDNSLYSDEGAFQKGVIDGVYILEEQKFGTNAEYHWTNCPPISVPDKEKTEIDNNSQDNNSPQSNASEIDNVFQENLRKRAFILEQEALEEMRNATLLEIELLKKSLYAKARSGLRIFG